MSDVPSDSTRSPRPQPPSPAAQHASPWAEIIGHCYTATSIGRVLGWDAETVDAATADLGLLALRTVDGQIMYPTLQVHDGAVVPGLQTVLVVLRTGIEDPWTWAQWLTAPPPRDLSDDIADPAQPSQAPGTTHIGALIAGQVDDVVRDARHDAAAWRA